MSDVKSIPAKDIKATVKLLNAVLAENPVTIEIDGDELEVSKLKVVGVKRPLLIDQIEAVVIALNEEEVDIDDKVVDFFNNFIADDDEDDVDGESDEEIEASNDKADEKPAKKSGKKSSKKSGKKSSGKKSSKKKSAKKEAKKTEKKSSVERDKHGFSINSKYHEFAELISVEPMKMSAIKKKLDDNYYNLVKKNPEIFAKNDLGFFYVIGSKAEKLANKMKAPKKAEKKAPAKKDAKKSTKKTTKKTPAKKTPAKKTPAKKTGKKSTKKSSKKSSKK